MGGPEGPNLHERTYPLWESLELEVCRMVVQQAFPARYEKVKADCKARAKEFNSNPDNWGYP